MGQAAEGDEFFRERNGEWGWSRLDIRMKIL